MSASKPSPAFAALQRALDAGDIAAARRAVFDLDERDQELLEARLGTETVARLQRSTRKPRRAPRGRVVVINGIMGARLDSGTAGDTDRLWVNLFRVFNGRLRELTLDSTGRPAKPEYQIQVGGLFPEYLLLLDALEHQWHVLAHPFDWRLDLATSAARLAERITHWANGEPVHIVAHSMGGLLARTLVKNHPEVWARIDDADGHRRGGRLVMLGTPNKGSFAIPLALTGEEKVVQQLAKVDRSHDVGELLRIFNTFIGSYLMLPTPLEDHGDDRGRLYDRATWGDLPVNQAHLDRARSFHQDLAQAIDRERMIYVAGYGQETPHRIKLVRPGRFLYQQTQDGDGRVPHDLGLLDGVPSFWVAESHGDLPRNANVLEGIHDLLGEGTTAMLESQPPARRGLAASGAWLAPEDVEKPPFGFETILPTVSRGKTPKVDLETAPAAEIERAQALLLQDYLGKPRDLPERAGAASAGRIAARGDAGALTVSGSEPTARLAVEVVWGDITQIDGDVFVVGHYQGVLPQNAELALDKMVSGFGPGEKADPERLVLTQLTRRGMLRGELGQVSFFPCAEKSARLVAVGGMGYAGGFSRGDLRRLARNLTWAISTLPDARIVNSVLIGSGAGNLPKLEHAVDGLITGLVDGLGLVRDRTRIAKLRIVERRLSKASAIHRRLVELASTPAIERRIELAVAPLRYGQDGTLDAEQGLAFTVAAASLAAREPRGVRASALATLLDLVPEENDFRETAREALMSLVDDPAAGLVDLAGRLDVGLRSNADGGGREIPTRLAFMHDGKDLCASALSSTAVIPERTIGVDLDLIDEAIEAMTDPEPARVASLSILLTRLTMPRDFRPLLQTRQPIVFEVDRTTARMHWEMLCDLEDEGSTPVPIALQVQVARQLRTRYSPAPMSDAARNRPLRALVVGDPGDPAEGMSLPGARREALEVAQMLRQKGVEVVVLIGAPSGPRDARLQGIEPANRLDVLDQLMQGDFDILHYSGHGDFDPVHPDETGWVFASGLLTARELERVDLAPRLVVANACLSGLTSGALTRRGRAGAGRSDAELLPSLADEFFRRGVRDYVGTAWEVDDTGAILFAQRFYDALIPARKGAEGETIGAALLAARTALGEKARQFGALWAAYQHYGDPTQRLVEALRSDAGVAVDGRSPAANGSARGGKKAAAKPAKKTSAKPRAARKTKSKVRR